jgi:acyl carrier protein
MEACEAAIALAVDLFGASRPDEIPLRAFGRRHVALALSRKASPWRTWFAREKWRAGTLWRCEKVAYRWAIKGAKPTAIHAAVWAGRLVRLPHLFVRTVGIMARALTMLASDRKQRKYFARVRYAWATSESTTVMTLEMLDEIKAIVAKRVEVPVEQVTHDTRLEDLGAGSLEVIEIVYDIEEKFGISVPIKPGESSLVLEAETQGAKASVKLETIGDIARAVQSLVDAKSRR